MTPKIVYWRPTDDHHHLLLTHLIINPTNSPLLKQTSHNDPESRDHSEERREQRKSLYITSKSDKTNMEIKLWGSSKFVSSPCSSDKEHGPGNLGREACMWKATYRGCCQQHSEMKTSISQECMFVLWLISDLSATCGLNFRTTVASCSSWMISFFFVLPCCVAVNPVLT